MLRLAIPKGRLEEEVNGYLERAGYVFNEKTSIVYRSEELVGFLVRPFDVPTYLLQGAADIGFCGTDVLVETGVELLQPFYLPSELSKMVFAGPEDKNIPSGEVSIATKFPNIAKRFCESKGWKYRIVTLKGSVELAPIVGLADFIVDITQTGRTLRENKLKVFEEILLIRLHVVLNPVSYRTKRAEIMNFLERLKRGIDDVKVS
ncbi:ATP phosphoribosyltransferase [Fervidobacterium sp.]